MTFRLVFRFGLLIVASLAIGSCAQIPESVTQKPEVQKRKVLRSQGQRVPRADGERIRKPQLARERAPVVRSAPPVRTAEEAPPTLDGPPRAGGASPDEPGVFRKAKKSKRKKNGGQPRSAEVSVDVEPDAPDSRVLSLYFATTREKAIVEGVTTLTDGRSPELNFGTVRVRVPEGHEDGQVERPRSVEVFGWTLYRQRTDERSHFVIRTRAWLDRDEFLQAVKTTEAESALVFVHGFNVVFDEGVYRLAQIVWDTQYKGVPILFSWASRGGIGSYLHDLGSARHAQPHFVELLRMLQDDAKISAIHVIAHSMGNEVALHALVNPGATPLKPINELIMAAPDVDRTIFEQQLARRLSQVAKGVTLYASSKDLALAASKKAHEGVRAGDILPAPRGPITAPNIDTIDVSALGIEMFGLNHSTFATAPSLIGDLKVLLGTAVRPPHERSKLLQGEPKGGPFRFWRYLNKQ